MQNPLFNLWGVRQVATDRTHNTCVANLAAMLRNRELGWQPGDPEDEPDWTAEDIQRQFGLVMIGAQSRVPDIPTALRYIEKATGRRSSQHAIDFDAANAPGDYAIFIYGTHVVYGVIGDPVQPVLVLDGNVGHAWAGWPAFLTYAATNETLYGRYPAQNNHAYLLLPAV